MATRLSCNDVMVSTEGYGVCCVDGLLLSDPYNVEKPLSTVDDTKSSGDELDYKEEACSRSGTDDAAERGSDSTRDELSESDVDTAFEPKNLNEESEVVSVPVPLPRRHRAVSSTSAPPENKTDIMKPVTHVEARKQKKLAPKRPVLPADHRDEGTN